jgi:hypothetical protein
MAAVLLKWIFCQVAVNMQGSRESCIASLTIQLPYDLLSDHDNASKNRQV